MNLTPTSVFAGVLVSVVLASPGRARADSCVSGENHVSPGDVLHDVGAPFTVAPTCAITVYATEDDPNRFLDPEALTIVAADAALSFTRVQGPDRVAQQPYGCWESDPPPIDSLPPDQLIERRWTVFTLTPDAPLPDGVVEVRDEQTAEVFAHFVVAAGAVGCADTEPPDVSRSVCSPGYQDCVGPEPDGGLPAPDPDLGPGISPDGAPGQGEVPDASTGALAVDQGVRVPDAGATNPESADSGCGCRAAGGAPNGLALLGLLALIRPRRRAR